MDYMETKITPKNPGVGSPSLLQQIFPTQELNQGLHFQFSLFTSIIGEGNGNPLQCSCLENPRDGVGGRGRAWWAAIYGVRTAWDTTEATQQQQLLSASRFFTN